MDKKEYKNLIYKEIYEPYKLAKGHLYLFEKFWCKHISPELNAIFLIRKKCFLESGSKIKRLRARLIHVKLIRRYGIHITDECEIDFGLRIAHPTSIVITKCKIGSNFQIYQNCTIGQKFHGSDQFPVIGNNVTMYASSNIIVNVKICDNVIIGANATVLNDILEPGVYVGTPAKKITGHKE